MGKRTNIYFRADGNSNIGLGHIIRSLALAGMLKDEFECHFIIQAPMPTLKIQILEVCTHIFELPSTAISTKEAQYLAFNIIHQNDIVVLDGYSFDTAYQKVLKTTGCKLVCIDDIHTFHFVADAVINHAPRVNPEIYQHEHYTQLCLGMNYSLLRAPFLKASKNLRKVNNLKNVFICFGGADNNNITIQVIKALLANNYDFENINVVIGSAYSYKSVLQNLIENQNRLKVKIHAGLSALEMCQLMLDNQLAIVPASSILFEVISVQMPILSGFYTDNQKNMHKGFKELGIFLDLGNFNQFKSFEPDFFEKNQEKLLRLMKPQQQLEIWKSKNYLQQLFIKLHSC